MIYVTTNWSLADILNNYDPFNYYADFGFMRPNDDRMSAWYCDAPDPVNSI